MDISGVTRAVTDEEVAARLEQKTRYSDVPRSRGTAFKATDGYLEICDGLYREKGWGLMVFFMGGIPALGLTLMAWYMAIDVSPAIRAKGQAGVAHWVFGLLSLVSIGALVWASRGLFKDCFNYTRRPIRFNRADQTIYAFRHNGPGGVTALPWDKAFFYVERSARSGLSATAGRLVRCLVLDEKGRVTDSFPVGKRVVLASSEEGRLGQEVMKELYQDFEYYRRFMEDGPTTIPRVESFLSTEVSFRNCLKLQFEDDSALLKSGNPFLKFFGSIAAVPFFIFSIANYAALRTCREPVWPDDVERACGLSPLKTGERVAT
ncbi:DUF6708 domain-containing protein [Paraburkholderia sp. BCC1876]|uniref:DUF6708 domain-containing protein n=1 Tax=Paraburkholderia sp. BCC1876 TaxID=2676303 RepID=UPI0015915136|nr:DUF6708 domain-containing protein [Paraburkholderia sp. BCC1876]